MKKKNILYIVLLSFFLITLPLEGSVTNTSPMHTLSSQHGTGDL